MFALISMVFHYYKTYKKALPSGIFVASFVAFIFLNVIENYVHYSIGRTTEDENGNLITFKPPSAKDWLKMIYIMLVFAVLQGLFTMFLSNYV